MGGAAVASRRRYSDVLTAKWAHASERKEQWMYGVCVPCHATPAARHVAEVFTPSVRCESAKSSQDVRGSPRAW